MNGIQLRYIHRLVSSIVLQMCLVWLQSVQPYARKFADRHMCVFCNYYGVCRWVPLIFQNAKMRKTNKLISTVLCLVKLKLLRYAIKKVPLILLNIKLNNLETVLAFVSSGRYISIIIVAYTV